MRIVRLVFALARLAVAAGIVAAVVGQLITTFDFWAAAGVNDPAALITNFFSFFTVDSNVASAVVLVIGAVLLLTRDSDDPRWFATLRGVVVSYMVVTGIVYNLLLRSIELPQGATLGWSNEILHVVAPLWMLLDWMLAPGRRPLPWSTIGKVVAFPIVWAVYTLIRGPFTPNLLTGDLVWYPYPFLNPFLPGNSYVTVAFYILLIAVVIGAAGAGVIWLSRRVARPPAG